MERINNLFLVLALFLSCSGSQYKDPNHQILFQDKFEKGAIYLLQKKIHYDLDYDGKNDTIKIFRIKDWGDPGDFQKIQIDFATDKKVEMYNLGDWERMYGDLASKLMPINQLSDNDILLTEISNDRLVLIIFGYTYASSPGKLTIIDINKGHLKVLFQDEFEIISIEDLDKDGTKEIIGLKYYQEGCCYEDSISLGATYSPYHVLKINDTTLIADYDLSEDYNFKHYVGFFGLEYDSLQRYLIIGPKIGEDFKYYFEFESYRMHPETSLSYLTKEELENLSKDDLRLMRNEIFAFHGYKFKSNDLNDYFSGFEWYKPVDADINNRLNKFEKSNINLIKKIENK